LLDESWVVGLTEIYINNIENQNKRKRDASAGVLVNEKLESLFPNNIDEVIMTPQFLSYEERINYAKAVANYRAAMKELTDVSYRRNGHESPTLKSWDNDADDFDEWESETSEKVTDQPENSVVTKEDETVGFISPLDIAEVVLQKKILNQVQKDPVLNRFVFVYSDIIKPRAVGSSSTRCLKVIPTNGLATHLQFANIEYHAVESQSLRNVSILITDEGGNKINFSPSSMPTFCTLHFKRRNQV
jgi:hypothetical protein